MTLMDRIEGPISQDDLLARLASVLETSGPFLHAAQTEQEERNMDRRIREEQDEAFLRSLEEDQERERRKKEEEEMQKREMEREKQEMAEMEKKLEVTIFFDRGCIP
jgi:FAS-associated factor 2